MKRQEKNNAKREAILDAALEQFLAKGLDATRVEDIARLAAVAKGTIYLYFNDKEAIFKALVGEMLVNSLNESRAALEVNLPLKEALLRFYQPLLEHGQKTRNAAVARLCFAESMRSPGQMRCFYRETLLPLMEMKQEILRKTRGQKVPEQLVAYPMLLTSPLIHGILWQGMLGDDLNLDAMFRAYLDLILPD